MLELLTVDMGEFTDRHVGKRVYNQDGGYVADVVDVRNGDLYVEVAAGADDETTDHLHWEDAGPHHLRDQYVSNVNEETVRLNV
ncbi:hypothetical protein [Halobacterium zhouii]|uniref:hypothetical protein n=1 Tax=Halobacterium zhouii TaxID=2902624 RepID=UPI001E2A600D|nr:hypothetical protein [Halobacterium zhouii]